MLPGNMLPVTQLISSAAKKRTAARALSGFEKLSRKATHLSTVSHIEIRGIGKIPEASTHTAQSLVEKFVTNYPQESKELGQVFLWKNFPKKVLPVTGGENTQGLTMNSSLVKNLNYGDRGRIDLTLTRRSFHNNRAYSNASYDAEGNVRPNALSYVLNHELGHVFQFAHATYPTRAEDQALHRLAIGGALRDIGLPFLGLRRDPEDFLDNIQSHYAFSDPFEFFAEMFGRYHTAPEDLHPELKSFVEKAITNYRDTVDPDPSVRLLNDAYYGVDSPYQIKSSVARTGLKPKSIASAHYSNNFHNSSKHLYR